MAATAVTAVATIGGSLIGASGAKSAAKTQAGAADRAADLQFQQYQQTRADMEPWRNVGVGALGQIAGLYGLSTGPQSGPDWAGYLAANQDVATNYAAMDPETKTLFPTPEAYAAWHYENHGRTEGRELGQIQPKSPETGGDRFANFFASPDYQFRREEGMRGIEGSAAAGGALKSGGTLKALNTYNSNLAAGEYGTWYNRLASLAGVGQTTNNQLGAFGANAATNAGNAIWKGADARAQGQLSSSQQYGNAFSSLGGSIANALQPSAPFIPGGPGSYSYSGDNSLNGLF